MKVGIVTAEIDTRSGWAQYSLRLIDALRDAGVNVTVAAASTVEHADLPVLPALTESRGGVLMRQFRALGALRRGLSHCDIIHTLVEPFVPAGVRVARERPHVMTAVGTYAALPLIRRWPVSAIYRSAFERSHAVAISTYSRDVLKQAAPKTPCTVVTLGVDAEAIQREAAGLAPFTKAGPVVLFVGAVKRRKGVPELIRALRRVADVRPDLRCVVIGSLTAEPHTAEGARAEIERLGLAGTVELRGHVPREELLRWYKTADVFVVPSMNDGFKFEGFGLVYLEAGSFGVPSIGTFECGARDAIDDGSTGLLVSQSRIDTDLSEAILTLLNDRVRREAMGAAAMVKARASTWAETARKTIAVYEHALRDRA